MKTVLTTIILLVILTSALALAGEKDQYNTKVLFHGTKSIADSSNWQLAGWSVFPNIGNGPILMVGGVRYQATNWWLETMAGALTKDQTGQLVFDVRASYNAFDPIRLWTNVEYFPKTGNWYTYLSIDYKIGNLGLIGIETENMYFPSKDDDLSVGPRVVLPLNQDRLVLIGAYQFHNSNNANKIWTRAVLNL